MKRALIVPATALVLLISPLAAVAQDPQTNQGGMMDGSMMQGSMMTGQGQMTPCGPAAMAMMASMAKPSMLPTGDGGVVVLSGEKLMKFDKELKLVKEVEIKIDSTAAQKMMQDMSYCQQCWKRRRGPGPAPGGMMQPGTGQTMQPGTGQTMQPGTGQTMQPGTGQTMQPGTGQTMQPGTGQTMQPGTGQTMQPGGQTQPQEQQR